MQPFDRLESEVRSYCRSFPTVFVEAKDHRLVAEDGREYIDFFAGAGALNYGHNPEPLKKALIAYLDADGPTHTLDMHTAAKRAFLETFEEVVLKPRNMVYKTMFPGPTGTNAVESALKIARKATGRTGVISFTNGFHGMTLGSLALTGNSGKRAGAGLPLGNAMAMPFDGYLGPDVDTIEVLERLLDDGSSGIELPAAFVVETVQAEGGVRPASYGWLQRLEALARKVGALLVIDDIQVGCGRTGPFFSFEPAGIEPDLITLSKSLSGYGLPLAVVLVKPEHDVFEPGEHNGTFRGHNPAFVTATAALEFWRDGTMSAAIDAKAARLRERLEAMASASGGEVRGRGLIQGIAYEDAALAGAISKAAFERGLIVETAGPDDEVVKLLPPLTIDDAVLEQGLDLLADAIEAVTREGVEPTPLVASGAVPAEAK